MKIPYKANCKALIEYDNETDKIFITVDPYGLYERVVAIDRLELLDVLREIEKDSVNQEGKEIRS